MTCLERATLADDLSKGANSLPTSKWQKKKSEQISFHFAAHGTLRLVKGVRGPAEDEQLNDHEE